MPFLSAMHTMLSSIMPGTRDDTGPLLGSIHSSFAKDHVHAAARAQADAIEARMLVEMQAAMIQQTPKVRSMNKSDIKAQMEALASQYEHEINKKLVEAGIIEASDFEDVELDPEDLEITDEIKERMQTKIAALKAMWEKDNV